MTEKPVKFSVRNCRFPHTPNQAMVVLLLNEGLCASKLLALATGLSTRTILRVLTAAGRLLTHQTMWTAGGKRRIWCVSEVGPWQSLVTPRAYDILACHSGKEAVNACAVGSYG